MTFIRKENKKNIKSLRGRSCRVRFLILFIVMFSYLIPFMGCTQLFNEDKGKTGDKIIIAFPGLLEHFENNTHFLKGVELAIAEVNREGGLPEGREIDFIVADDEGSFNKGMALAQTFAKDEAIAAVVGHWHTHVTLPASAIYEENSLILLSPVVSNTELTNREYRFVFRNIPGDDEIGREMARYALYKGLKRLVILHDRRPYGLGLANAFEDTATSIGVTIIDRRRFFLDDYDREDTIKKWEAMGYDGIFVAASKANAEALIISVRDGGADKTILGGDSLDFGIIESIGDYAEGVIIATMFNPEIQRPRLQDFINKFEDNYGIYPDIWAVQGYDSVKLLAHVIKECGSVHSAVMADFLRDKFLWEGLLSDFSFNEKGEAEGIRVYQKTAAGGKYIYLDPMPSVINQ